MNTRNLILSSLLLLNACASRHTILTVPAVSMTKPSMGAAQQAKPSGEISAEYCEGDDSLTSNDNNVGLIDEAVMKAQRESGALYISDVTITQKSDCVMVEGTAMK